MSEFNEYSTPSHPSEYSCIDFVNSSFADHLGGVERIDRLSTPEWQQWFLDRHALRPKPAAPAPIEELIALRRNLRRTLEKWSRQEELSARDVRHLDDCVHRAPTTRRVAMTAAGLELREEPARKDWNWVMATLTTSAVHLVNTGDPHRLKTCGNPNCTWMFYDPTNNRSKQFCSTAPCGVLMRVRRFRDSK